MSVLSPNLPAHFLNALRFARGTLADAINMPADTSLGPDGTLLPGPHAEMLASYRGKIIAVIGSQNGWDQVVKVR